MPTIAGPNRGTWLSAPVCGRHWHGRWEPERVALVQRLVQPGDVVWDIGAHHGMVAMMAARQVGPTGCVHAFEPSPSNFAFLMRHLRWNGTANVTAHKMAVGAAPGERRFGGGHSSQTGALDQGEELVQCTSMAALLDQGLPAPTVIKLDAEGCEGELLEADAHVLPPHVRLLVSIHSAENYRRVKHALAAANFQCLESRELTSWACSSAARWARDPDLIAFGPTATDPFSGFRSLSMFG